MNIVFLKISKNLQKHNVNNLKVKYNIYYSTMTEVFRIPENVNCYTPAFWASPIFVEKDDKLYYNGEVYAEKIKDHEKVESAKLAAKEKEAKEKLEREKAAKESKKQQEKEEREAAKEGRSTEIKKEEPVKKDTKKSKDNENTESKRRKTTDIYFDTIGDRTRHWGDIYCTIPKNYEKPILLYKDLKKE
jgi:hypothetical protein